MVTVALLFIDNVRESQTIYMRFKVKYNDPCENMRGPKAQMVIVWKYCDVSQLCRVIDSSVRNETSHPPGAPPVPTVIGLRNQT